MTNGTVSNGILDVNDSGSFTGQAPFSGSIGPIDTTNGRAVLTTLLGGKTFQSAVYIVSGNSSGKGEALFAKIDTDSGTFAGSGLQQSTTWCPTTGGCKFTNDALAGNAVRSWHRVERTIATRSLPPAFGLHIY